MEKKYDQKFVFGWKDGKLDFSYEQDGKFGKGELNKNFDFGQGRDEILADAEWASDPATAPSVEPARQLLVDQPSVPVEFVEVPEAVPVESPSLMAELAKVEPAPSEDFFFEAPVEPVEEVSVPEAPMPAVNPVLPPAPVVDVLVDANKTDVPTVQVRLPEVMPQIVSVDAAQIGESVDTTSAHAQVVVEVTDASVKVPEGTELTVVKTKGGSADMVVAISPDVKTVAGVDVVDAVKKAMETWETAPALPDLTVTDPDDPVNVMPQVVEMKLDGSTVVVKDVSEDIPTGTALVPVVTPNEMPNIVAAIDDETKATFEKYGLDPATELGKFLAASPTEIATSTPVHEKDVYDAFGNPDGSDLAQVNYEMTDRTRWRRWW